MLLKTYIVHVASFTERRKQLDKHLANNPFLDPQFILEGDIADLNDTILDRYFKGRMHAKAAGASCVYKHLRAFENLVEKDEMALILEDDIHLNKNFTKQIKKVIAEAKARKLEGFIISLDDSILRYVKGSERVKGQLLYKKQADRFAGCYLMDKKAAKAMLEECYTHKIGTPVDHYQSHCARKGLIDVYWAHPTIAVQGSLMGSFQSELGKKRLGKMNVLSFKIQRIYKRLLYRLR
ncbi:MAG: glycosyltransferase family 25 protein [Bacteroidetes bacterium]|nr:glycosyltransferase family 25 protein [Bacteroidota bacterium]